MTTHFMTLNARPFERIKSGTKTYELRLYDEKRKKIHSGNIIEFTKKNSGEKCVATVMEILPFKNFAELYANLPLEQCGYSIDELGKASPTDMDEYYTKEQQELYGVVAIKIKL